MDNENQTRQSTFNVYVLLAAFILVPFMILAFVPTTPRRSSTSTQKPLRYRTVARTNEEIRERLTNGRAAQQLNDDARIEVVEGRWTKAEYRRWTGQDY